MSVLSFIFVSCSLTIEEVGRHSFPLIELSYLFIYLFIHLFIYFVLQDSPERHVLPDPTNPPPPPPERKQRKQRKVRNSQRKLRNVEMDDVEQDVSMSGNCL